MAAMKRRQWAIVITLLVVTTGLAATLWWVYLGPTRPPNPPPTRISPLRKPDVDLIRVRYGSTLVVIRRGKADDAWHLSKPVNAPVDKTHLDAILSLLNHHADQQYPPGTASKDKTGLANPVVVRFNDEAPIRIGDPGPDQHSRYVATAHNLLHVRLPEMAGLHWSWTHWISPALVPSGRQLQRIILPHFTLDKSDDGSWHVLPSSPHSHAAATATLHAWQHARARRVAPADQSRQRSARITLIFAHGSPRHLDIIERDPELILRDPALGVDYQLSGDHTAPLLERQNGQ